MDYLIYMDSLIYILYYPIEKKRLLHIPGRPSFQALDRFGTATRRNGRKAAGVEVDEGPLHRPWGEGNPLVMSK